MQRIGIVIVVAMATVSSVVGGARATLITDFAIFGNTGVTITGGADVFGAPVGSNSGTVQITSSGSLVPFGFMSGGNFSDLGSSSAGPITVNGSATIGGSTVVTGDINSGGATSLGSSYIVNGSIYAGGGFSTGGSASGNGITGSVHNSGGTTVSIAGSGKISGDLIADGGITIGGSSNIAGSIHSDGTVSIGGSTNLGTPIDATKVTINATGNVTFTSTSATLDGAVNSGGNVSIGSTTNRVTGNVVAVGTISGGTVDGTRTPGGSPAPPLAPTAPISFNAVTMPTATTVSTTGATAVTTSTSTSHASPLAPGNYTSATIGSNDLFLTTGDYHFSGNFATNTSLADLRLNVSAGPINIFINGNLTMSGSSKIHIDPYGTGTYYTVAQTLTDPDIKAAVSKVFWETHGTFSTGSSVPWMGTVLAPNNTISVGTLGNVIGALYSGSTVTLDSSNVQVHFVQTGYLVPELTTSVAPGGTLSFGTIRLGTDSTQTLTVSNTGHYGSLDGNFPASGGPFALAGTQTFSVAVSASDSRTYSYNPTARGLNSQSVSVTSNAGNTTVALSGTGVGPVYTGTAAPGSTIAFGNKLVGGSAGQGLSITNTSGDGNLGDATLMTIHGSSGLSGGDVGQFSATGTGSGTLQVGDAARVVNLAFAPTSRGAKSTTLNINTDENADLGSAGASFAYAITGTGVAPLQSTGQVNAGLVRIGTTGTATINVSNTGDGNLSGQGDPSNLHGSAPALSGDFMGAGGVINLPDAGSAAFNYTFSPASRGPTSANLTISYSDGRSDGSNTAQDVPLELTATAVGPEATVTNTGDLSISALTFGAITVGSYQDLTFRVRNDTPDGDLGDLTDLTVLLAGTGAVSGNADDFSLLGFVSDIVIDGTSYVDLTVRFAPGAAGPRISTLTLQTDQGSTLGPASMVYMMGLDPAGNGQVFTLDLSGTGVQPAQDNGAVPEPATAAVLALGALLLAPRRRT